jgi:hypothetical protein
MEVKHHKEQFEIFMYSNLKYSILATGIVFDNTERADLLCGCVL